jgi:hypothetical protein
LVFEEEYQNVKSLQMALTLMMTFGSGELKISKSVGQEES